jgi:hypothetical protein
MTGMFSARTTTRRREARAGAAAMPAAPAVTMAIGSRWTRLRSAVRTQCAAEQAMPGRRGLQLCLGSVWLLDAALQYQPFMFGPRFVTQAIEPTATGNPAFVAASVIWASHVMLRQVAICNTAFASIQLLIALGLFIRRTIKPALAITVIWALFVWWFGEGLGGILTGASPLTGMPGAVLLYGLIAVLLWPPATIPARPAVSPAAGGPLGATVPRLLWLALWASFAGYLLLPENRGPDGISRIFSVTDGQPGWMKSIMNGFSRAADHHGLEISVVLAVLCASVALAVLTGGLTRPALHVAASLGLLFWLAEGLGGILTGKGTDPNTGPLLILLAACYWPRRLATPGGWSASAT